MSRDSLTQSTTDDLVAAATAVATAHMARYGPAKGDETGEIYVPLDTVDILVTAPTPPLWAITIYQRKAAMPIIAIVTNHDGGRPRAPYVAYENIRLRRFMAGAAQEMMAFLAGPEKQEGQVAA